MLQVSVWVKYVATNTKRLHFSHSIKLRDFSSKNVFSILKNEMLFWRAKAVLITMYITQLPSLYGRSRIFQIKENVSS